MAGVRRWHTLLAAVALVVPLAVYVATLTPTVPFWDSGEYIATSYILGLPHPPGNPVYTMIGRILSFVPIESIAWRVNFLSALASALAVFFTFLVVTSTLRRFYTEGPRTWAEWLTCELGGLTAAFFLASSKSFWDSAVEAEVYSVSSFLIAFSIWLAYRWWDRRGTARNDWLLVLIVYLLAVSTGVHLATILVAPGLLLLFIAVRPSYFATGKFWSAALLLGGMGLFFSAAETFDVAIPPLLLILLPVALAFLFLANRRYFVQDNLMTWWVIVLLLGLTVQLFLLIRSQQMPAINEGAPVTVEAWKDYLLRKQYGPSNPFVRRADLGFQIQQMYLRYVGMQFPLLERIGALGASSFWVKLVNAVPFLLFFIGAWWNYRRHKVTFWFFLVQNLIMGPALIFYLNFTDHEVRERDYFFTNSYHFIAIWIGMGAAAIFQHVAQALAPAPAARGLAARAPTQARPNGDSVPPAASGLAPLPRSATALAGIGLAGLTLVGCSLLPMRTGWYVHDRSGFWVAQNYAYNMLAPLERDAIIFTNGDNDTFPLWYIQEVERFRKDVRVVNLSLLNTPWYIRQLRDLEPKVPLGYTDAQLDLLEPELKPDGRILWVKDKAVANIIETNRWQRPLYLAVTVPELMGLDPRLTLEGLVFRIRSDTEGRRIDVETILENLYKVFRYRGLLDSSRNYDRTVYKDDNAYKLAQNYTAAHVQAAYQLHLEGRIDEAIRLTSDALHLSPDFPSLLEFLGQLYEIKGDLGEAEKAYEEGRRRFPNAAEYHYRVGILAYRAGRVDESIALLRQAVALDQQYFDWFNGLFTVLWESRRQAEALDVLRTWLRAHPEDTAAALSLKEYEDSLRILQGGAGARPSRGAR